MIWGLEHARLVPSARFESNPTDLKTERAASRDISHLMPVDFQSPEKSLKAFEQGWSQRAWGLPGAPAAGSAGALGAARHLAAGTADRHRRSTGTVEIHCGVDYLWPVQTGKLFGDFQRDQNICHNR